MKNIGATFFQELQAAGLTGLPFTWNAQGEFHFTTEATDLNPEPMTQEQVNAVLAVYDAHDPNAEPPPEFPTVVSRFQGLAAMLQTPHGDGTLLDAVEALIADPQTDPMYKLAWNSLQEFHFDSEMLIALAGIMGLTEQDRIDLFILADSIKV